MGLFNDIKSTGSDVLSVVSTSARAAKRCADVGLLTASSWYATTIADAIKDAQGKDVSPELRTAILLHYVKEDTGLSLTEDAMSKLLKLAPVDTTGTK